MEKTLEKLYKKLSVCPDILTAFDEPMSRHTTFKIGGAAKLFCELKSREAILKAMKEASLLGISPFIIGNGSNILVSDDGIDGAVYKISGGTIKRDGNTITADAGVTLTQLARFAMSEGLAGFECAYGIPATVGGAVFMNAGAYGFEMKDVLIETTFLDTDGNVKVIDCTGHEFGYRTSFFKTHPGCVIIDTKIRLSEDKTEDIQAKMSEIMARRRAKQPLELPSAGSTFKRPEGHYAGALIEQCGLKGYTIGGAQVSVKHAGFIVNIGGATCSDVQKLIEHIKETVLKQCGVELQCEVLCAPKKL